MFVGFGIVLANLDNNKQVQQSQPQKDMVITFKVLRDKIMDCLSGN